MEWKQWSDKLKEALGLESSPVAITYTNTPCETSRKHWACGALKKAAEGEVICLGAENSSCPGANWHLGFAEPEDMEAITRFLVEGEKLFSSPAAVWRMNTSTKAKPPSGMKYVVFSPLEEAELMPDAVVFLCNAEQASRLVNLACYLDGLALECEPSGSLCMSAIAYPIATGRVNVTFGDITARRLQRYHPGVVFVSMPYTVVRDVMYSLERCSAGTAEVDREAFKEILKGT